MKQQSKGIKHAHKHQDEEIEKSYDYKHW